MKTITKNSKCGQCDKRINDDQAWVKVPVKTKQAEWLTDMHTECALKFQTEQLKRKGLED